MGAPRDLRRSGHVQTKGDGIVLGRDRWRVYRTNTDHHVMGLGAAGSGKSTTMAIPTALLHTGSMLVIDPSGDIVTVAGRRRRELGPLHEFNPLKPGTARFNPLLEFPADHRLIGMCQYAAAMLTGSGREGAGKDPFWDRTAAFLIAGLLHHVRLSDDPSLGHAWRLLQAVYRADYQWAGDTTPFAKDVIEGFCRHEPKLRDSIITTAISHLKFLADPIVQEAVARSDFSASDLLAGERPGTIAITIPEDQADRLRPLTRLMLEAMIRPLLHDRRTTPDGRRKLRNLTVLIDDFPALETMSIIELGLADGRKYGLRFLLLAQSVNQIERYYTTHQSLIDNCGTVVLAPGFSERTLRAAGTWAGKHLVPQVSQQRNLSWRGGSSSSESETQRNVLDPSEMLVRAKDQMLVFTTGTRPVYLDKIRYWQDRAFKGLFDDPNDEIVPVRPAAAEATLVTFEGIG